MLAFHSVLLILPISQIPLLHILSVTTDTLVFLLVLVASILILLIQIQPFQLPGFMCSSQIQLPDLVKSEYYCLLGLMTNKALDFWVRHIFRAVLVSMLAFHLILALESLSFFLPFFLSFFFVFFLLLLFFGYWSFPYFLVPVSSAIHLKVYLL